MKKFLKFLLSLIALSLVVNYFFLYTIPWPELTSGSASYLSLKRVATAAYTPAENWDDDDTLLSTGVLVGVGDGKGLKRVFILTAPELRDPKLEAFEKKQLRLAFNRGNHLLGVKRFTIPENLRSWDFDDEGFSMIEITDAIEELEMRGVEIKYLNLEAAGLPSELTKSHDERSISGVGVSGAATNPDLAIGVGAELFTIVADQDSQMLINPFRKLYLTPFSRLKGKMAYHEYVEDSRRYYAADFKIEKGNIGAPVFAYATYKGVEYPFLIGIISHANDKYTLITPIDVIKDKILLSSIGANDIENDSSQE